MNVKGALLQWRLIACFCTVALGIFAPTVVLAGTTVLLGFSTSPYYDEQVVTFRLTSAIRLQINAPSPAQFDAGKPVGLAFYALPNGSTIEQTVGKAGDDWHYDIQHIGAQTRYLRGVIDDYNLVVVYLEAKQKSWPAWKSQHPDHAQIIKSVVEYVKAYFRDYRPFIVLTGHSGGGRFIFSFMDAFRDIPDYVTRICFLDSDYGYENAYGDRLVRWLNAAPDHYLSVLAYNDSVALYNGQPIVSPTGGTWYRTRMMQKYLANFYAFNTEEDKAFIRHRALDGRINIVLKKNPQRKILHTVQVEKNGFIHTMLTGTSKENDGYKYYGDRAYSDLIQPDELTPARVQIPLRSPEAMDGCRFMQSIKNMSFADREKAILRELATGNIPYFLRNLKEIESTFYDANGNVYRVQYRVMPDYLAIGSDSNFCRVPMGPITAQKAADFFGTCLPTRKLVDDIYRNAEVKLAPVTYTPVGHQNESVEKFIEHNAAIEAQRLAAGARPGQLIGGIKKDVVLSNKIADPQRPNHVTIYGWHKLNGRPIQPLTNIHNNTYVDYSHGIRYLDAQVTLNGQAKWIPSILKDSILYKILSDEEGPMPQPTYIPDNSIPDKPRSFGVKCEQDGRIKVLVTPADNVSQYCLYKSADGKEFTSFVTFASSQCTVSGLASDSLIFIRLCALNAAGRSAASEVLAVMPRSAGHARALIVNGFDRPSAGNTFDFIRQHATAMMGNGLAFDSATNDAVVNGLFSLQGYPVVDYILGDESTVDESFSLKEQQIVSSFLQAGGGLFVSGSEVAWDLDYKGTGSDQAFLHNYLKAKYSADAPGGVAGVHYTARGLEGGLFAGIASINFDDGTHGTINVKYADALVPVNGGRSIVEYQDVTSHTIGGVSYEGVFPGGVRQARLVYLGFPFETIYPASTRGLMMQRILSFLYTGLTVADNGGEGIAAKFVLAQNYPNPFNPSTTIRYTLSRISDVTMTIYNCVGARVQAWHFSAQSAGEHEIVWDGTDSQGNRVSSGTYFYRLSVGRFVASKEMVLIK